MTHFLASVRDAAEAEIAVSAGADIIDLKEPANGALGAVDRATSAGILAALRGRVPTSATIGDLPMQPDLVRDTVRARAVFGVDYVKVGLLPDGDPEGCLEGLRAVTGSIRLIVVLFADRPLAFDAVEVAARIGATGLMLDTAVKGSGCLLDHLPAGEMSRIVSRAKARGLSIGLAGSLRAADIPILLALQPDVLGFRGALCRGARTGRLDSEATRTIRALIPKAPSALVKRAPEALNPRAAEALC